MIEFFEKRISFLGNFDGLHKQFKNDFGANFLKRIFLGLFIYLHNYFKMNFNMEFCYKIKNPFLVIFTRKGILLIYLSNLIPNITRSQDLITLNMIREISTVYITQ